MDPNNPGELKISLLVEGMTLSDSAAQGLGTKWQEKIYSYSLTDWVDRKIVLPSDIKLDRRVFVGFRYDPSSSWELIGNDSGRFVRSKLTGKEIQAELIPRPSYYDLETTDGQKMQSVGVSCGNHGVSFFVNSYCEYFAQGENCKFCGLVPTQKKFSDSVKLKRPSQVQETTERILDSGAKLDFIQLSGGSRYDHDSEVRSYLKYISLIHRELEKRNLVGRVPIHLTSMPPTDLGILKELRSAGLDTISFDLECPTPSYFEKYCPGKHNSYGYQGIRHALRSSISVFGEGKVFSIVIMGLEPRETFTRSLEGLIEEGVVPTLNIYHYDPLCSKEMDVKSPCVDNLIEMTRDVSRLFKKHGAVPGNLGCAHYDIGHEIKKGYFN